MSAVVSLFAWAASLTSPGIQDERAVFIEQQSQIGHLYDTADNFTAAFNAFAGTNVLVAPTPSAPSATVVPLNLLYLNVKDPTYGAIGDGVADDTLAIQTALSAAAILRCGVFFPGGDYLISATLIRAGNNISMRGSGMTATRILWKASAAWATTGMLYDTDTYNHYGNDCFDLTFDANGQGGQTLPAMTALVWAGSRSTWHNVAVCNRPGSAIAGTPNNWCILGLGNGITFDNIYLHDDYSPQFVTTAMPSGLGTLTIPVPSSAGVQDAGLLIIDPSVAVTGVNIASGANGAISSAGTYTILPTGPHDNPFPNGGRTTGMDGIFAGQVLSCGFGTVASVVVATPGSGGTDGTYTCGFTGGAGGTGGGAYVTITVSGGTITNLLLSDPGWGNASAPSVSTAGIAGLTGATFTVTMTDLVEQVTVSSVTNSTWTGLFTGAHPVNFPVVYAGTTETCKITSHDATHITVSLAQVNNTSRTGTPATLCLIARPWTSDGLGLGTNHMTGRPIQGIKVVNSRFERLAYDGCGWATSRDVVFDNNTVLSCAVGCIPQDCPKTRVTNNLIDMSYLGITPSTYSTVVNGITITSTQFTGILLFALAPEYSTAVTDVIIANNTIIGGSYGISVSPQAKLPTSIIFDNLVIANNTVRDSEVNGLLATGLRNATISGNTVRNPARGGLSVDPIYGGAIAGMMFGAITGAPLDAVAVFGNTIDDAYAHMNAGIRALTSIAHTLECDNNRITGAVGQAIQYTALLPITARNNPGYNPRGALDTSSTSVCYPAMPVNGQPATGTTYTNVSGVDMDLYPTTAGGATAVTLNGATIGASLTVNAPLRWQAGQTLAISWTGTQPVLKAIGQ